MRNANNKIANRFAIRKFKTGVSCVAIAAIFATGPIMKMNAAEIDTGSDTVETGIEESVEVNESEPELELELEEVIEDAVVEETADVEEDIAVESVEPIVEDQVEPIVEDVVEVEETVVPRIVEETPEVVEPAVEDVVEVQEVEEPIIEEAVVESVEETEQSETTEAPIVEEDIVEVQAEVEEPIEVQALDVVEDNEEIVEEDTVVETQEVVDEVPGDDTNLDDEESQIEDIDDTDDNLGTLDPDEEVEVPAEETTPDEIEENEDVVEQPVVEDDSETVEDTEGTTEDEEIVEEEEPTETRVSESEIVNGIKWGDINDYPIVEQPKVPGYTANDEDMFVITDKTIDYYKDLINYEDLKAAQDYYNELVSQARLDRGLTAVNSKDHVTDFAFMRAVDMVMNDYYYTSKHGTGQLEYQEKYFFSDEETRPFTTDYTRHGISIARTTRDFAGDYKAAMDWMFNASYVNSESIRHRMNQDRYTHMGIGLFRNNDGYTYFAQIMYADGERNPNELVEGDEGYVKVNPDVVRDYIDPEIIDNTSNWQEVQLNKINQERLKLGHKPLTLSNHLSEFAYMKALDMDLNNYYAHVKENVGGQTAQYYYFNGDLALDLPRGIGENIQTGFDHDGNQLTIEETAFNAFYRSPGHFGNMTNANYTHVGLGLYQPGPGQSYKLVQVFYNDAEGILHAFDETGNRVPEEDVIVPAPTPEEPEVPETPEVPNEDNDTVVPAPEKPDQSDDEEQEDTPVVEVPSPEQPNVPEDDEVAAPSPEQPNVPEDDVVVEVPSPEQPNVPEDDEVAAPSPEQPNVPEDDEVVVPSPETPNEDTTIDNGAEDNVDEPIVNQPTPGESEEVIEDTPQPEESVETPTVPEADSEDLVVEDRPDAPEPEGNVDKPIVNRPTPGESEEVIEDAPQPEESDDDAEDLVVVPGNNDTTAPVVDTPAKDHADAIVEAPVKDAVVGTPALNNNVVNPSIERVDVQASDLSVTPVKPEVISETGNADVNTIADEAKSYESVDVASAPLAEANASNSETSENNNADVNTAQTLPNTGTAMDGTNIVFGSLFALLGAVTIAAVRRKSQTDDK